MFTGLIEELGIVKAKRESKNALILEIGAKKVLEGIKVGDSIATNGLCLTCTKFTKDSFFCDIMKVSLDKSNLAQVQVGSKLNLERALKLGDRLGGHLVSGHIDCKAKVVKISKASIATTIRISYLEKYQGYLIAQGSIAINGVSLTISKLEQSYFEVSIIPHSLKETNLADLTVGSLVNLEFDQIAKYIEKQLPAKKLSPAKLASFGF